MFRGGSGCVCGGGPPVVFRAGVQVFNELCSCGMLGDPRGWHLGVGGGTPGARELRWGSWVGSGLARFRPEGLTVMEEC